MTSANPEPNFLINEFKNTLIKAYAYQMLHVANVKKNDSNFFGIIVTYKPIYLGSFEEAWNWFLKDECEKIAIENNLDIKKLPIENVFMLDLSTWDHLMLILKDNDIKLERILEEIKVLNQRPESKKFNFGMYLDDYEVKSKRMEYLQQAFDIIGNFENAA